MAITETDKLAIREIAREIVNEVGPSIAKEAAREVIDKHIKSCPVRAEMKIGFYRLLLLLVSSGCIGGGVTQLFKIFGN